MLINVGNHSVKDNKDDLDWNIFTGLSDDKIS